MGDVNKSVEISLRANLSQMKKGLKELPGMTKEEAKKMVSALETELKKSERAAKKAAKTNARAMKEMRKQALKTKAAFRAMTKQLATGAAVAAVAVAAFAQHIADLSNEIDDSATKTGVAAETLLGLRLAAEGAGVSFGELETGLVKLPSQMLKVQQGSKGITKVFDRLEVSVEETRDGMLKLRDADSVLKDLFESLNKVESAEEKAALAAEIFGRTAGPKLIQSGALSNLDSFVSLSKEFGISTGPEMSAAMADYQRVSSAALQTITGEAQRMLDTFTGAAEGGGMSAVVMKGAESFIFLSTVAQDTFNGIIATFSFLEPMFKAAGHALTTGEFGESFEYLRTEADKTAKVTDNMLDTFARGTVRINAFRVAVGKTLGTGEGGGGDGSGEGSGESPAVKSAKQAQEILKSNAAIAAFTKSIEAQNNKFIEDRLSAQIEELTGADKLEAQILNRTDAIYAEIAAIQEKEQALYAAIVDNRAQEEETLKLMEALNEREIQLEQEKHDLFAEMEEAAFLRDSEFLDAELAKDLEITNEKIANREKLAKTERELIELQKQATELVLSGISDVATTALNIAENSYEKNKGLVLTLFRVQQAAAVAELGFHTATAVMSAFSTYKGAAPIAIAGILATSAAQLAQIMTQQPPKMHTGGIVGGSPDEVQTVLLKGEGVLSRETVDRIGGEEGLRQLEQGQTQSQVIVMSPYKHFDRFQRDRSLMGIGSTDTGRRGY